MISHTFSLWVWPDLFLGNQHHHYLTFFPFVLEMSLSLSVSGTYISKHIHVTCPEPLTIRKHIASFFINPELDFLHAIPSFKSSTHSATKFCELPCQCASDDENWISRNRTCGLKIHIVWVVTRGPFLLRIAFIVRKFSSAQSQQTWKPFCDTVMLPTFATTRS